jgi:hypothetical protein
MWISAKVSGSDGGEASFKKKGVESRDARKTECFNDGCRHHGGFTGWLEKIERQPMDLHILRATGHATVAGDSARSQTDNGVCKRAGIRHDSDALAMASSKQIATGWIQCQRVHTSPWEGILMLLSFEEYSVGKAPHSRTAMASIDDRKLQCMFRYCFNRDFDR